MKKCVDCNNTAKLGEDRCGRCQDAIDSANHREQRIIDAFSEAHKAISDEGVFSPDQINCLDNMLNALQEVAGC